MEQEKVAKILQKHIPEGAISYCFELWKKAPFHLKLRKSRITKVGDFTCRTGKIPQITINQDLHTYSFLITYIHEVAHLYVHQHIGHRVEAHGREWKLAFQQLMLPMMSEDIFSVELLLSLRKHMANPKASTFSDPQLTATLRQCDQLQIGLTLLSQIPEGSVFGLRGRWFKKGKLKRTRVLCKEVNSRRNYLVPADVPVENAQLSLL